MDKLKARPEFSPFLGSSSWDWYQATISEDNLQYFIPVLRKWFPNADWRPTKPNNGYQSAQGLFIGDRRQVLICFGGNNSTANILTTSDESHLLHSAFLDWGGSFKPTRMDACIDWEELGLFDSISASLVEFAKERELTINHQGDWSRGVSRTLYIGAKSSPVQIRLYEKGFEVSGMSTTRPNWVRFEVQVRPAKTRRLSSSAWLPSDLFGCGWVADAVERFFIIPSVRFPVGYEKQDSDRAKRRAWLCKVGKKSLLEWLEDAGGDTGLLGQEIAAALFSDSLDSVKGAPARGNN